MIIAEGERIAVTDTTERMKRKMAAKGGTNYLRESSVSVKARGFV
jgi:hypothetical protein